MKTRITEVEVHMTKIMDNNRFYYACLTKLFT